MNKEWWDKLKTPDKSALKAIEAGRLKGKTDINPQWRYEVMTEVFGPCGIGWKYTVDRVWQEDAADGQKFAFAAVSLYVADICNGHEWSAPIPGYGGSMLLDLERNGMHSNDEAYKMAITDALGTAMKMLGVAADIYRGSYDGSKYSKPESKPETKPAAKPAQETTPTTTALTCPKCSGAAWDNRGKKTNPKAPDAKCRDKNCDGVIWHIKEQGPEYDEMNPPPYDPESEVPF